MKYIFIIIIIFCFNSNSFCQKKIIKDHNSAFFYNYILDSFINKNISLDIEFNNRVSKFTNDFPISKLRDYSKNNNETCIETLFDILKNANLVDSAEVFNLRNSKKELDKHLFKKKNVKIIDDIENSVVFTEPLFFSNNNFAIVSCYEFRGASGIYIFKKVKRKWIYFDAICKFVY